MIVENGKIVEATEDELYQHWLDNWDGLYSFDEYLRIIKNKWVKIIDN